MAGNKPRPFRNAYTSFAVMHISMDNIPLSGEPCDSTFAKNPRVMSQIIVEDQFKDKWQQCFWCWTWGMEVFGFLRPIGVGSVTYHESRIVICASIAMTQQSLHGSPMLEDDARNH